MKQLKNHTIKQNQSGRQERPDRPKRPSRQNRSNKQKHDSQIPPVYADSQTGLTRQQVEERMQNGLDNQPVKGPAKTVNQIVFTNIFTFFNLIFAVLAVFIITTGSFRDLLFMVIVIANTGIGIVQELRAKWTLDKLSLISSPHTVVIREGQTEKIETALLVRDDVVQLSSGNQICADATVLTGEIQVNEALVTGESKSITKKAGDALLSGSFVTAGACRARLDRVGAESYISTLTVEAKKTGKRKKSEMMASLNKLIITIGIIIVPLGLLLFRQQMALGLTYSRSVISTTAALIGMIPEGLYLLTSVALAVSVIRLAKRKTLVQELNCIETLARVNVMCVDKTGTITEDAMSVSQIIPLQPKQSDERTVTEILSAFYKATRDENQTAAAMKAHFTGRPGWKADKLIPFSSSTKWSAASFGDRGVFVVGAPEFILKEDYEVHREMVEQLSSQGCRVLLLAEYEGPLNRKLWEGGPFTAPLIPLALVAIQNKIRKNAPEVFRFFKEQGVEMKVISGDNPLTVSQVAAQAGIDNADHYVDASSLTGNQAIKDAAERFTVFGRVTPEQKRKLIRALKNKGNTVAMTGDGVNDVLALKEADCSVAMASGSEAACHVSQLVLLNSDFSSMPQVVLEGRRVINNIQRATSLFLVKNIFSLLLSVLTVFFALPYPLTPTQLTLVSMVTIGVPSLFLALEPNKSLVKGHFLSNVVKKALPGALTDLLLILGILGCSRLFHLSTNELSTISAITLAFVGLLVLLQVCRPLNLKRKVLLICMTALLILSIIYMNGFFNLTSLSMPAVAVLIGFLLLSVPLLHFLLAAAKKLSQIFPFLA